MKTLITSKKDFYIEVVCDCFEERTSLWVAAGEDIDISAMQRTKKADWKLQKHNCKQ